MSTVHDTQESRDETAGRATEESLALEVVRTRQAPPDPAILKAIGLNHSLESAAADLVDNSIDAGATRVLLRFVIRNGLVARFTVVDNGRGMTPDQIDSAMTLGMQRDRAPQGLGHFGVGLKAASFSQASLLTVLSRKDGVVVGRRVPRDSEARGFAVEELSTTSIDAALAAGWSGFQFQSGTIVIWEQVRTCPKSSDRTVTSLYLERKVASIRHHLGLVYHRLIEQKRVRIDIDVYDTDADDAGFPFDVAPVNPFAYSRSGADGYPKSLTAQLGDASASLECHIWPPRSDSRMYKLAGIPVDRAQGFYFYRNDRLLSFGGWAGAAHESKRRRLARVSIDIDRCPDGFMMSMEKSAVSLTAGMVNAIETATSKDGTSIFDYLQDAEQTLRVANKRRRERLPKLPPGQGVAPSTKRAISQEVRLLDEEPMRIRWRQFASAELIEVDRRQRTLWLNEHYRAAVLRGRAGSVNDVPILKALLYLLFEDVFRGTAYGAKDKDNVRLWTAVLTASAIEESEMYGN